jgi:hypothetical protein
MHGLKPPAFRHCGLGGAALEVLELKFLQNPIFLVCNMLNFVSLHQTDCGTSPQ